MVKFAKISLNKVILITTLCMLTYLISFNFDLAIYIWALDWVTWTNLMMSLKIEKQNDIWPSKHDIDVFKICYRLVS